MIERNGVANVGVKLNQVEITLFRAFENKAFYAFHRDIEGGLRQYAAKTFPLMRAAIEGSQVIKRNVQDAGGRDGPGLIVAGNLINETLESHHKLVGRIQKNVGFLTSFGVGDVGTESTFQNKSQCAADRPVGIVNVAFFILFVSPAGA